MASSISNKSKIYNLQSIHWGVIVAALFLTLLLGGEVHAAAAPGLRAEVKAGLGGNYHTREWFGVLVTLTNDAEVSYKGTLTLEDNNNQGLQAAQRTVQLAGRSRKQVWLYALAPSYANAVNLRLRDGGNLLLDQEVSLSFNDNSSFLLAVVGGGQGSLGGLNGAALGTANLKGATRTVVASIGLEELPPTPAALNGLDALVIAEADSSQLTEPQRLAIRAWVVGGGDLVISGGPSGASNAVGFADMLPVTVGPPQPLDDLSALSRYVDSNATIGAGQVVASGATLRTGRALVRSNDGRLLLAQRDYGRGRVTFLAVDPNLGVLKAWSGYAQLWAKLFATHYVGYSFASSSMYRYNSATLLPQLQLPPLEVLLLVMFFYILIVGPLNYILLQRLGRREWAWLTIPTITLIFAVVFYTVGYQSKGNTVLTSRLTAIFYGPTDTASVVGTLGIFSPGRTAYTVNLSDSALAAEAQYYDRNFNSGAKSATLELGSPNRLTDLRIPTWSQRSAVVQDSIKQSPPFSGSVVANSQGISLTVRNLATAPYRDVIAYSPSLMRASAPFSLAPGQSKAVDVSLPYSATNQFIEYLAGPNNPDTEAEQRMAKQQLIETLIQSKEAGLNFSGDPNSGYYGAGYPLQPSPDPQVYIVAWSNSSPLPLPTTAARDQLNLTLQVVAIGRP